jgi:hypothetical protein
MNEKNKKLLTKFIAHLEKGTRAWEVREMNRAMGLKNDSEAERLNLIIGAENGYFISVFCDAIGLGADLPKSRNTSEVRLKTLAQLYVDAGIVPGPKEAELIIEKKVKNRAANYLKTILTGRTR